jgi:hypothetical protein
MKKLINVLLSAILAISVLAFTACDDGGNVFEADYKETSATELASLVSSVDSATNSDEINFNDCVKLTLDVDVLGSKVKK